MTSLTDLREQVDVVIGVDTHVHTHSAAVLDTATGGVLDEVTVEATTEGYAELMEFANTHATLRAWAIEGTSGHGAGLTRHLLESSEIVLEMDRPKRAARRNGAKSDPLDAIRAAREAMARPRVGSPRAGGDRQALSVLLAARRSAVNASKDAQLQVFSLVVAAPEPIRARFRGQKVAAMLNTAAKLRVQSAWDVETSSTVVALRTLARRAHTMRRRPASWRRRSSPSSAAGGPTCSRSSASDRSSRQRCCAPGPTPAASTPKPRSRCSPGWHPSRRTAARSPPGIGSTATATGT